MAAPLLISAVSDIIYTSDSPRHSSDDAEEDREIEEGEEEDEQFRKDLARRLRELRSGKGHTREGQGGCVMMKGDEGGVRGKEEGRLSSEDGKSADPEKHHSHHQVESLNQSWSDQSHQERRTTPVVSKHQHSSDQAQVTRPTGFWRRLGRFLFGAKEGTGDGPKEGDPDYVYPKYRWTPIFSGIVQPFSILLEIPSLTEHWYVRQVDGVPIVYQENPVLLDVGLAISMLCGVIANVALISRFLERRVFASTIVCIVMLSIHDIINITALIIFGVIHGVDDGFDYSEAFWMCVCSTTASFFTNITLIFDIVRTKQFRHSGSGLTPKQRKLVVVTMVLLVYIALGALAFNFLIPDIAFQNALYFTVVTIETIGFGDISPPLGARVFLFFYVPIGILNLAVAVGTARDTLVESWSAAYRQRRHNVIKRQRERKQQRIDELARFATVDPEGQAEVVGKTGGKVRRWGRGLKPQSPVASAAQPNGSPDGQSSAGQSAGTSDGKDSRAYYREALAELSMENEDGYRRFQERMKHEEKMENLWKFGMAGGLFIVFWLVGAGIFTRTEDTWDFFTSLYFCFVTFTTIGKSAWVSKVLTGYGDVVPTSPAGRAVFIIWAICGVGIVTLLIAVIAEAYSNRYHTAVRGKKDGEKPSGEDAAVWHWDQLSPEEVENLPNEIVELARDWQAHLRVARLSISSANPHSLEVQAMMDEVLAGKDTGELAGKRGSQADRRQLFWNSYEKGLHRLVHLAEETIKHVQRSRDLDLVPEPGTALLPRPVLPETLPDLAQVEPGSERTRRKSI